ncbi:MAG: molybdopterin-dependent oxidoreductase [Bacillota bacterium]|jgi:DMSO/TMAO reductase YedYZ molybdopterin-dependent catalytic subunit
MAKMKKSTMAITAVIIVLIIVIGIFAGINQKTADTAENSITVQTAESEETVYTIDDLKKMEEISTVHKTIKSGSKEDETGDFTGISVRDLLLKTTTEEAINAAKAVTATSGDGYATSYEISEIMEDENVMLIFQQDGADLVPFSEGGSGPLRIVVMKDEFGNRSAMWVTKISLE